MAIRINRVYTRTGDRGTTRLVGGAEVQKDSLRVDAYGAVDELNSVLGLARTFNDEDLESAPSKARKSLDEILKRLQNELFDLGSELATPEDGAYPGMFVTSEEEVRALERVIDRCQKDLQPLASFILPGGGRVGAFLHQARTVCRRAERDVLRLSRREHVNSAVIRYLNRLSDLLFVLSRWIAHHQNTPEYLWERGLHLTKGEGTPTKKAPPRGKKKLPATPKPGRKEATRGRS